jgi:hypothetical protein
MNLRGKISVYNFSEKYFIMKRKIKVFYHMYISPDFRASYWHIFLDMYMKELISSNLYRNCDFYITITMPKNWVNFNNKDIVKNSTSLYMPSNEIITFEQKVKEYIKYRYPFAIILDIRDISETNIYEGHCLDLIHKMSMNEDFDILYTHSKGVMMPEAISVSNWREVLIYFMITKWKKCLKWLEASEVVGILDNPARKEIGTGHPIFPSGNFWWSKSEYIRSLPEPIKSEEYMKDFPEAFPGNPLYRYSFERWITVNLPKFTVMYNTNAEHYLNYCIVENLYKQRPYIIDISKTSEINTNGELITVK